MANAEQLEQPTADAAGQRKQVIWGTNISAETVIDVFYDFVTTWKKRATDDYPHYVALLEQMIRTDQVVLNLDCQNLHAFNPGLYENLVSYPQEIIPMFDMIAGNIRDRIFEVSPELPTNSKGRRVEVRPYHLQSIKSMRELNPEDIDKLVSIKGMVVRSTPIVPDLRSAYYECIECKNGIAVVISLGKIVEPAICDHCKQRRTLVLVHNRSSFDDKQYVKMQETPDSIPEGSTPQTVQLAVHGQLVDVAVPGDKVMVTGIYRASAIRPSGGQRNLKQIYKTFLDVVHFSKTDKNRMSAGELVNVDGIEVIESNIEKDEVEREAAEKLAEVKELSTRHDIYDLLTQSIASGIWEMDDVKKGILCQLFGGSRKRFRDAATGRFRSEVNILLCGDPGVSKSQLLQYVHKIAPRGLYTSGKGSSAVGLTAYVTKDPDTGEHVLESGALVLSDRGICCIDEFDKMSDHTRSVLHEAMEQQTVSVAKAGIICTLNARTSILASANPKESRYNPRMSVVDNIQLPPTLLSRFDLIYLLLDTPDQSRDTKLAKHLVSLYFAHRDVDQARTLPTELLSRYIAHARHNCDPELTDEASEGLIAGYVEMRKRGESNKTITATTRQLESLIRLSEALAKMRLSDYVLRSDVDEAIRLMKLATFNAATDPRTGLLDMDLITTGHGAAHAEMVRMLKQRIMDLVKQHTERYRDQPISTEQLFVLYVSLASEKDDVQREDFNEALLSLQEEDRISIAGRHIVPR